MGQACLPGLSKDSLEPGCLCSACPVQCVEHANVTPGFPWFSTIDFGAFVLPQFLERVASAAVFLVLPSVSV